ncbi:MAG: malonyl-CoA decarboxylase family protein [bacterium]
MLEERHFNLTELREKISDSITGIFRQFKFIKPVQEKVENALYLLSTEQTAYSDSLSTIRKFYNQSPEHQSALFQILDAMDPKRIESILNQIFAVMDTPEWLIVLREDFINLREKKVAGKRVLPMKNLNATFKEYFSKIFNFQYFNTRVCNLQNTSVKLLKYIAEKEGVHPSAHWWSFENRLNSPDRIILSIEHFKMPSIPLVYIEIAFSRGLIRNIESVIGSKRGTIDVSKANTAIFYSINTTFKGLQGIGAGRKMIIRAKEFLKKNYPQISRFATLSPVPEFRSYLETVLDTQDHDFFLHGQDINENREHQFFTEKEIREIRQELKSEDFELAGMLKTVLEKKKWYGNPVFRKNMKSPLKNLMLYYLKEEKRHDRKTGLHTNAAFDPVENFHLSNGAYIGGINFCANVSPRGVEESFGFMVNYIYDEKKMDADKLRYSAGEVIIRI